MSLMSMANLIWSCEFNLSKLRENLRPEFRLPTCVLGIGSANSVTIAVVVSAQNIYGIVEDLEGRHKEEKE